MEYRILGPFEVLDDGVPVDIGRRQQRALLALLLVNVNRVVSTERILEQIWPGDPTGKERTLWVYISRLRAALEPGRHAHAKSSVLVTKDHGYMLRADRSQLDSCEFESLAEQANGLIIDDPDQASEILRRALGLWRGSALEEFEYDDFAQGTAARLEEQRVSALELQLEAELRANRHREVLGDLERLVRDHPFREGFVRLQMTALYRSGRQADALRAFERFRRSIGDELGLEPSPELRRVEEYVLLHDERLTPPTSPLQVTEDAATRNPFIGLHSFGERDASNFFGRERLITDLLRRVSSGARLIALVGASGSGKSSVLHAGFVPAIRKAAIEGSDRWLVAKMVPGARPFRELEAALLRSSLDAPDSIPVLDDDPEDGLLRACLRLLPDTDSRIVLVIDQFEELFTLATDNAEVDRFVHNLEVVLDEPHGRVVVAIALRADYYGRPLEYPSFSRLLGNGVVNLAPLLPDELEAAAEEPAAAVGVAVEPALVVQLLSDVAGRPGALPLFQYTLTELFDRRHGSTLTIDEYRAIGGVAGALQRAEELFLALSSDERGVVRQLFLRLVAIGTDGSVSRRRLAASEILTIDVDLVVVQQVLADFAQHRLVTLDRDAVSGSPTVEVAHEALLEQWPRLREWIERGRRDVRQHDLLVTAMSEWQAADCKADYLLSGDRLADYEAWIATSTLQLTAEEQAFVDASVRQRDEARRAEELRAEREHRLDRQARVRLWGLVPGGLAIVAVLVALVLVLLRGDEPAIAVVHGAGGDEGISDMMIAGVGASERERDVAVDLVEPLVDPETDLRRLAESGTDLIVVGSDFDADVGRVAPDFPDVHWVALDPVLLKTQLPNVTEIHFATEHSAFLAGAAAAHATTTGKVGFIGGFQSFRTESSRNGFTQGVAWEDRGVEVTAAFLGPVANPIADIPTRGDLAHELALEMYAAGIDVIFHDAGAAGAGIVAAALASSNSDRHLWTIGSDADEFITVSDAERAHVLTSTIKRFDVAVESVISGYLDGDLEPGEIVLGLGDGDDGAVSISTSGGHIDAIVGPIANLQGEIAFGHLPVSTAALNPPEWQTDPDVTVDVVLRDNSCEIDRIDGTELVDGELLVPRGSAIVFRLTNESGSIGGISVRAVTAGVTLDDMRRESSGIEPSFDGLQAASLAELGGTTSAAALVASSRLSSHCIHGGTDTEPSNIPILIVRPTA